MAGLDELVAAVALESPNRLSLPEHRQIDLGGTSKILRFSEACAPDMLQTALAGVLRAFLLVEAAGDRGGGADLAGESPAVPSASRRLVKEIFRVLRVCRLVLFSRTGEVALQDGVLRLKGVIDRTVMILDISFAGLMLLESAVAYWMSSRLGPYPLAYVEVMLGEYYFDLIGEIRQFSDENRGLYQFQRPLRLNRHFRLDCDNPRWCDEGDAITFLMPDRFTDPSKYPIDLFVEIDRTLRIVPIEALSAGRLSREKLDMWRARLDNKGRLPSAFRSRFGHDVVAVNQPMS